MRLPSPRALGRAAGLVAVTVPIYLLLVAGLLVLAPSPRGRARWQGFVQRLWSRALCRVFGMRIRWRGAPPEPPYLLVSNHLSYLDIFVLGSRLPCPSFIAKSEIAGWPIMGFLARHSGNLFVDRARKRDLPRVIAEARRMMGLGRGVVIFAEGTSSDGTGLLPFRPSLLALPARLGVPVHYAAITYRTPPGEAPASEAVCWWGDMPLVPHLRTLLELPEIQVEMAIGETPVHAADRKTLARSLHAAVAAELGLSPPEQAEGEPAPAAEAPEPPAEERPQAAEGAL